MRLVGFILLTVFFGSQGQASYYELEDCEVESEMTGILLEGSEKNDPVVNAYDD